MARISFSALVEEITGKLAGSVFQDSYGGFQIRTRVTPRNPRSNFQQLRRGQFGFISQSWKTLTSIQRQTFIAAAVTAPEALNLFIQANVNLTLIEEPTITDYVPSTVPDQMIIEFDTATPAALLVKATGAVTAVPANTKLLVQVTYQKEPTKIFTNPSQYSPLISFDEGTDLSAPTDILSEWQARYGVFSADKRLCLKSNLIDKTNGLRGPDSVNCTTSEDMATYIPLQQFLTDAQNTGAAETDLYSYTLPANTLVTDGEKLLCAFAGDVHGGTSHQLRFYINAVATAMTPDSTNGNIRFELYLLKTSSTTARLSAIQFRANIVQSIQTADLSGLDFTASQLIKVTGQSVNTGDIIMRSGYIDQVKV